MENKKTLFERLFPYHVEQIRLLNDEEKAEKIIQNEISYFNTLLLLAGMSCVVLLVLVVGLSGLRSKTISKALILTVWLIFFCVAYVKSLREMKQDLQEDMYLVKKWIKASVVVFVFSVSVSGAYLVSFVKILGLDSATKNVVHNALGRKFESEDLGIRITIPKGWSKIKYSKKFEGTETERPRYTFTVEDEYRSMWVDIQGWRLPESVTLKHMNNAFTQELTRSLDDRVLRKAQVVGIDRKYVVHKIVGTETEYPDDIFIRYTILHRGTVIRYSYKFKKDLDFETENKKANDLIRGMEFFYVNQPDYVKKSFKRSEGN